MRMPGFYAEVSLNEMSQHYQLQPVGADASGGQAVIPQFCANTPCLSIPGFGGVRLRCCARIWPPRISCSFSRRC